MVSSHIFLVGMAGSGKSSLGQKLAGYRSLPFLDTDQAVSQMMNMSVPDIYKSLGESFFHNAETGVLVQLVDAPPCVVSTGAGLPVLRENVILMRNHGIIIHIDRPLDQLIADMRDQSAEPFSQSDYDELVQRYNSHIGYYRACADHTLSNDKAMAVGAQGLIDLVGRIFGEE